MKEELESQKKYESMRRAAAASGGLKRTTTCACGRPAGLVWCGHRWQRLCCCGHCGKALGFKAGAATHAEANDLVERRAA